MRVSSTAALFLILQAVSDVSVTDGARSDRAKSFVAVDADKIVKIVEFWPEPRPAPENRRHRVELRCE